MSPETPKPSSSPEKEKKAERFSRFDREYKTIADVLREINLQAIKKTGRDGEQEHSAQHISVYTKCGAIYDLESFKDEGFLQEYGPELPFLGLEISFHTAAADRSKNTDDSVVIREDDTTEQMEGVNAPDLLREYHDKIQQILGAQQRQLDEGRKIQLVQNLDRQRQAIHNRAAENIILNKQTWVSIPHEEARKLFEAMFYMWEYRKEDEIHFYGLGGGEMDDFEKVIGDRDVEHEILNAIAEQTGIRAFFSEVTWGFHLDDPRTDYTIRLRGDNVNILRPKIDQIVLSIIRKHLEDDKRNEV